MTKTVDSLFQGKHNNFNAIRLLMALAVIYNHSFVLFRTDGYQDLTNYVFSFFDSGSLAVGVFFLVSGMLLSKSYFTTSSRWKFILKRILRIFPGLIVCLIFTVLIIGTINTSLPLKQYFSDRATYRYFYNVFLNNEFFQFGLPGVFAESKSPLVVNGSLWTLPFELTCYIFLFIVYTIGTNLLPARYSWKQKLVHCALILFFVSYLLNAKVLVARVHGLITGFNPNPGSGNNSYNLFMFFAIGMVFYGLRKYIRIKVWWLLGLAAALVIVRIGHLNLLQKPLEVACISYSVLILARVSWLRRLNFDLDPSYGIYLYAWPVQQTIAHYFSLSSYASMLITVPITICLGWLSYKFVEGPAIGSVGTIYKKWFGRTVTQLDAVA